ncbi:MAG: cell division protein FtsZ, partial [Thermoplasmatales archaeon]|nr:cell division protein FtsZ [Thermoplasmatales archaeon]
AIDPDYEGKINVMIVATGVKSKQILGKITEEELRKKQGVDVIR